MNKFSFLCLFLLMASPAYGTEDALKQLEADANNINTISPEQEAEILSKTRKTNYYRVNNYSPQKLKAIIKYKNQVDKRYARKNNQEYEEPEQIDVNDKIGLKYFFQKDINTEVAKQQTSYE